MKEDDEIARAGPDAEREADELVRLVGEHTLRTASGEGSSDVTSQRYFDWWAREVRMGQRPDEVRALNERAAAFAERVLARLSAEGAKVRRCARLPARHPPAAVGSLRDILSIAAREGRAPVLDLAVAAGIGRELWEETPAAWLELPPDVPRGEYLALAVAGDSMEPLLSGGDVILVRIGAIRSPRGQVVVVRHPEDGYLVKRVSMSSSGQLELTSLNPAYPPVRIPHAPGSILGSVVLVWREGRERTTSG